MHTTFSLRHLVKLTSTVLALSTSLVATASFAASNDDATLQSSAPLTANVADPSSDASVHQKTRAEVYQELIKAQRSGELARESATYHGV